MKNVKWIRKVGTLAFLFLLSVGASAQNLGSEVKIGAIETLTGDNSAYGISIKNALELAVSEINASKFLGKTQLTLKVLDDKGDKQEGVSVMNKILNQEKVSVVIGPTLSSTAFAADPLAQKAGVPVLGTSNTANGITAMGEYIFRNSLPESGVIPGTIAAVKAKLNPKKAAILYEITNEFTKSAYEVFKKSLEANGIAVVATESYNKGDTDFRTQLGKLKASKPDIIVVSALIGEAIPILQQAREVGLKQPIVGGNGFNSPKILATAQEAANGLVVGSAWFSGSPVKTSQDFIAAYKKKYSSDPDQFAAQAYCGVYLVAQAIKNAQSSDPKAIRAALAQLKKVPTILGEFSFDADRNPVHPSVTLTAKDGKFVLFD